MRVLLIAMLATWQSALVAAIGLDIAGLVFVGLALTGTDTSWYAAAVLVVLFSLRYYFRVYNLRRKARQAANPKP
jgi:hypothetical protein